MRTSITAIASLLLFASACNSRTAADRVFDQGHMTGRTYVNDYFGLRIAVPRGWVVQNKEQTDKLMETGSTLLSEDTVKAQAMKKAVDVSTAFLLTVFRSEVGTTTDYNPSFLLLAENLHSMSGIKKGSDYLSLSRKMLEASASEYAFGGDLPVEHLDGADFDGMMMRTSANGTPIRQDYFTVLKDGFALSSIMSYANDAQRDTLRALFRELHFVKR